MKNPWHKPTENDAESWPEAGKQLLIAVDRDGYSTPSLFLGDVRTLEDLYEAFRKNNCATVCWAYAENIAAQAQAAI